MNILLDSALNSTIVMMAGMESTTITITPSNEMTVEQDTSDTDTKEEDTNTEDTGDGEADTSDKETDTGEGEADTNGEETDTKKEGTDTDTEAPAVDDQTGQDVNLDTSSSTVGGDVAGNQGMTDSMVMGEEMGTTKEPFLASWPAVIGISGATILLGLVIGFLLAKKKIKKGFEIYED